MVASQATWTLLCSLACSWKWFQAVRNSKAIEGEVAERTNAQKLSFGSLSFGCGDRPLRLLVLG